jgi:hypothetical protein
MLAPIMKTTLGWTLVLVLPLLFSCAASSRGGFDDGTGAGAGGGVGGGSSPNLPQGGGGGSNPSPTTFVPPTELGCASRAQDILALDFRSGWWSGGGGGGYSGIALPAVVESCPKTAVDYHHFENGMHVKCVYAQGSGGSCQNLSPAVTVADIRASFVHASVNDYTQIWVLSGSDQDPTDIPVGDQLFQGILGDTTGACIPMLVAAGDGFMTHAKTIANDLGMGDVFKEETTPPSFFSVSFVGAEGMSTMSGPSLSPHLIFKNVSSIVDHVGSLTGQAHGDSLAETVAAPHVYQVVAHDSSGKAAIAVGAAKVAGDGFRPFIFDAGWQRTYVLGDAGTKRYLQNIVMYMGLVGCKAAPIGPVN